MVLGTIRILWMMAFLLLAKANADTWCIEDPANLPCGGAPGECTRNQDYSDGGFVANSARVTQTHHWPRRNKPFIGRFAQVCQEAIVLERARVYGRARVFGKARLSDDAQVYGNAQVFGDAYISGRARVYGEAQVAGHAQISENAQVFEAAQVTGDASGINSSPTPGESFIQRSVMIYGNALIYGTASVFGRAQVYGEARVFGNAQAGGNVEVQGRSELISGSYLSGKYKIKSLTIPLDKTLCAQKMRQRVKDDFEYFQSTVPKREALNKSDLESQKRASQLQELDNGLRSCPICLDALYFKKYLVASECGHLVCRPCFGELQKEENPECPECRWPSYIKGAVEFQYPSLF